LLALVELATDTSAVFRAVQTAHDVDGLDQTAVLLQGAHRRILSAVALEFADEQRSTADGSGVGRGPIVVWSSAQRR
jgi:hypothetical protein